MASGAGASLPDIVGSDGLHLAAMRLAMSPAGISPRACTSRTSFITGGETAAPAGRLSIRRRSSRRRASAGHVGDFDSFDPTSYAMLSRQWLTSGDPEQHCKD